MVGFNKNSFIVVHDDEAEFNQIDLSRKAKILKKQAEEDGLNVTRIFRMPAFDNDLCEKKWLDVIDEYQKTTKLVKIYVDNLNDFKELTTQFTSVLITYLVDIVTNKNLEIFNLESRIIINKNSTKEQWFQILQHKHSKKVEEVAISNEFDGTDIFKMDIRINWETDILFMNSVRISNEFKDLFNYPQKWLRRVCLDYGKIENVIAFYRVKHPNIKLYKTKETTLRAWNFVLSMFDMETTKLLLERKYGSEFNIKRTSK